MNAERFGACAEKGEESHVAQTARTQWLSCAISLDAAQWATVLHSTNPPVEYRLLDGPKTTVRSSPGGDDVVQRAWVLL